MAVAGQALETFKEPEHMETEYPDSWTTPSHAAGLIKCSMSRQLDARVALGTASLSGWQKCYNTAAP